MLGTSLTAYAKDVVREVVCVGRAGSLVDWENESEQRAYVVLYQPEQIINWRMERVNGRNVLSLVVLREAHKVSEDGFETKESEQLRVLRLVSGAKNSDGKTSGASYQVELWRPKENRAKRLNKAEWELTETKVPLRLGKPLPLI